VKVRIYIEGGFEGSTLNNCRRAFRIFFEKVVPRGSFHVIACGDRVAAFSGFRSALEQHRGDFVLLLVDSEGAVSVGATSWQYLESREGDKWKRPKGASDEQAHLMVQVMESWFLADRQALSDYYGEGFLHNSLPRQPNIEKIPKEDVFKAIGAGSLASRRYTSNGSGEGNGQLTLRTYSIFRHARLSRFIKSSASFGPQEPAA
jgi:hypothetical protein